MNFAQKLVLLILITISIAFVYFSYFKEDFEFPKFSHNNIENETEYSPFDKDRDKETQTVIDKKEGSKTVKIYVLDKNGNLRSLHRTCDMSKESSCFEYAIKELIKAPSKWEKSKGFTSEIPAGTKLLSVRDSSGNVLIDLSSDFETGGGAESTYMRIRQVIKTANSNTSSPTYLYINGKQANVIGGEGVMLKQPLNERSLDE